MGLYGSPELLPDNNPVDFDKNLVLCPKCNFKYSKYFKECPKCGAKHRSKSKILLFICIITLITLILIYNRQNIEKLMASTFNPEMNPPIREEIIDVFEKLNSVADECILYIEQYQSNEIGYFECLAKIELLASKIDKTTTEYQNILDDTTQLSSSEYAYIEQQEEQLYNKYIKIFGIIDNEIAEILE